MTELFINSIDLSPYIVGVSETGNIIGIKAPPELVHELFQFLAVDGFKTITIYLNGDLLKWLMIKMDAHRGWIEIELKQEKYLDRYRLWLRFDE